MRVLVLLFAALLAMPSFAADDATIRVRVFDREAPQRVSIRAEQGPIAVLVDGHVAATLAPGSAVDVARSGSVVTVNGPGLVTRGSRLSFEPRDSGHLSILAGRTGRSYRGSLDVSVLSGALALINVVPLDHYIASVVPMEYPFQEIEGVKAQAVLVRTYALKSRGRFGDYDVVDHVGSQVYRGIESETPLAREAAGLTRGEVLTFKGDLIEAVYYSSSGGHTANNESVWDGQPLPYLRGLPDPYDHASPLHRWTETIDRDRLLRALSRHYGFSVTGISVERTNPDGRVTGIRLHGARERVEQANRFRLTANDLLRRNTFKSTYFTLERRGGQYVVNGRGFGHGVGMSQYGAREQARQGHTYREILYFYYTDVRLERRYSFEEPDRMLAEVPPPVRMEPRPPTPPATTPSTRTRIRRTGW